MFGSSVLETGIGVIFLFLILSILVSSAREILEGWLQTRAGNLEHGIREILQDDSGTLLGQLYQHPQINALFRGPYQEAPAAGADAPGFWARWRRRRNLPAYIPARNFALALLDLSASGGTPTGAAATFDEIRARAASFHNPKLRWAVLQAMDSAHGDLQQARANLERWYDSAMDRVSGWYRKQTQTIAFALGLVAAVTLNIDTVSIAGRLYRDDTLRAVVTTQAESAARAGADHGAAPALNCRPGEDQMACAQRQLDSLRLPLGWGDQYVLWPWDAPRMSWGQWLGTFPWPSIPGWLLTALAIAMGAPFWFDLLNKFVVVRSTVKPDEKSPEEASKDRQPPSPPLPAAPPAPPPAPPPPPPPPPPTRSAGKPGS